MSEEIQRYLAVVGEQVIDHLTQLARPLRGVRVLHVNSTRVGGGVAEILDRLVPLMRELGIDAAWEVIEGDEAFYTFTKNLHNALQGNPVRLPDNLVRAYQEANARTAQRLAGALREAEFVFIHDPQPAQLIDHLPNRQGKWIWRCHIDVSRPFRPAWRFLRPIVGRYDASVFSLASFAQPLPHPQYLIAPSIDPLSEKNVDLPHEEIEAVRQRFGLDPARPLLVQVSRFDRFKDPVGVIRAYRMATRFIPSLQLVLAGGEATDDPEGGAVLEEVRAAAEDDPDVHVLLLRPDAHRTVNALQRAADIVVQTSIREGFGLTVAEALWKGRPVVAGNAGGIRLQVIDHHTGFLVDSPEGAALRIRYLLNHRGLIEEMGRKGHALVLENFLLTRHLREYLTLCLALGHGPEARIELT